MSNDAGLIDSALSAPSEVVPDKPGLRAWAIVAICLFGISTGPAAFGIGSIGVFVDVFQTQFGWGRGEISSAISLLMLSTAIAVPIAGILIDRFGPRAVLVPSIIALGLCMIAAPMVRELWQLQALYLALGTLAAGSNSVAYMRILATWFDRSRGLAIGIAGSGTGLGFAYIPILTEHLKSTFGWAFGYYGMAALALCVTLPLVLLVLRERPQALAVSGAAPAPAAAFGMTLREAMAGRDFWVLAVMFMGVSAMLYGLLAHLVPLLTDKGYEPAVAAQIASVFGLATFAGRILIGFLVDRFDARRIALIFFMLSALGLPLLALDLPVWVLFASALMLGGSLGAEVDMLAYLASRYFGLRYFARIFGVLFGIVMLAMGVGPVVFGAIFDATGSYALTLLAGAPICAAAALCTLLLRSYSERARGGPVSVT